MYIVCSCLVYFDQSCLVWETFSCVEVVHFHFDQLNSLTWLNFKWIPVFEMVHIVEVVSWWDVFFFPEALFIFFCCKFSSHSKSGHEMWHYNNRRYMLVLDFSFTFGNFHLHSQQFHCILCARLRHPGFTCIYIYI